MAKKSDNTDITTRAILYDGANISQLCVLFGLDNRTVVEKLHKCQPTGLRHGVNTWRVRDAAPYLTKPLYDIEAYIKKMHHNDLPKHVSKEYWAGLRSRQEYELKEGNLWPTDKVVSVVGEFMKLVKMSVRLQADAVDRQDELTDGQRRIVKQLGDAMLEELHRTVVEAFTNARTGESRYTEPAPELSHTPVDNWDEGELEEEDPDAL